MIPAQFVDMPSKHRKLCEAYVDLGRKAPASRQVGITEQYAGRLLNHDQRCVEYVRYLRAKGVDDAVIDRETLAKRYKRVADAAERDGEYRVALAALQSLDRLCGVSEPVD